MLLVIKEKKLLPLGMIKKIFTAILILIVTFWVTYFFQDYTFYNMPLSTPPYWENQTPFTNVFNKRELILNSDFLPPVPKCSEGNTSLVIVVCSAAGNYAARNAIRLTWGRDFQWTQHAQVFFIIGRSKDNITDLFVSDEKEEFGDVIHYDFLDTYNNLTLKSIMLLKWATSKCQNANYVMKIDDDMYVNIPFLLNRIYKIGTKNTLVGKRIINARPVRDMASKWYAPKFIYSPKLYPNYLSGTGYIMSKDVANRLYRSSLSVPYFYLEDVFITGLCAKNENISPVNDHLFTFTKQKKDPCVYLSIVTAHKITPKSLLEIWKLIHNLKIACVSKFWDMTYPSIMNYVSTKHTEPNY